LSPAPNLMLSVILGFFGLTRPRPVAWVAIPHRVFLNRSMIRLLTRKASETVTADPPIRPILVDPHRQFDVLGERHGHIALPRCTDTCEIFRTPVGIVSHYEGSRPKAFLQQGKNGGI
jgi:hypothetical protein